MWPKSYWPRFERQIRKAAGLGRSPTQADPARYDKMNAHCDVLVIGGGPAGLASTLVAGRAGARVMLVDEQAEFGGSLLSAFETINGWPAAEWIAETPAEIESIADTGSALRGCRHGRPRLAGLPGAGDQRRYRCSARGRLHARCRARLAYPGRVRRDADSALLAGAQEVAYKPRPQAVRGFSERYLGSRHRLAAREGYQSIQHVKRYTALGFGTDQGELGNINGMAILARTLGQTIPETGTTTFRPAYTPVSFGAMAGRETRELYDPIRKTAMHGWHVAHGALFENVGQWKRPWYYPKDGETMQESLDRECLATREHVGVLDSSTLGKIEVHGPDASEFLDMIYTGGRRKMKTGTCRYGLMLHEDGMIFDDGVTAKLGDNHYLLTTTSGCAAGVLRWLEEWQQTEWPHMDVFFTSMTDQWATIAVNGPESRKVVETVCHDIDLSNDAFPFMAFREGTVAGVAARVFRISFTGELSFEINIDANYGRHVWDAIMAAGEPYGITPCGTETMHILRAEKGFIVVGQDTDGTVTPMDMGMNWAIGHKKIDFIGKRSLERSDIVRDDRKQFVGLLPTDPKTVLPEGAQLVGNNVRSDEPTFESPVPMEGYVSSSYYSAALDRSIALALVKGGHQRHVK